MALQRAPAIAAPGLPMRRKDRPMTSPTPMPAPMGIAGKAFAFVALVEALTWSGLLAGMFLKYATETTDAGVWLFGRLHGLAFLAYVATTLVAATRLRWPGWALLLALLAAVPPLLTWPLERWFRRRGLLSAR